MQLKINNYALFNTMDGSVIYTNDGCFVEDDM